LTKLKEFLPHCIECRAA